MRSRLLILLPALPAFLASGCDDAAKPSPAPSAISGERLKAAKAITDPATRNAALAKVALAAASPEGSQIAHQAITIMADPALKDSTASECAKRLAKYSDVAAARQIAMLIGDPALRNATLAHLAEGK